MSEDALPRYNEGERAGREEMNPGGRAHDRTITKLIAVAW